MVNDNKKDYDKMVTNMIRMQVKYWDWLGEMTRAANKSNRNKLTTQGDMLGMILSDYVQRLENESKVRNMLEESGEKT